MLDLTNAYPANQSTLEDIETYYRQDVDHIKETAKTALDVLLDDALAHHVWARYSDDCCANWLNTDTDTLPSIVEGYLAMMYPDKYPNAHGIAERLERENSTLLARFHWYERMYD